MSIADLKVRLADVQGVETLTMGLEAGRIMLRWGAGYSALVDAAASDADIEAAIRNAIKLPAVFLIQDKPAAIATPAPSSGVSSTVNNPASAGASVKALMEDHVRMMGDIHQAQLRILESSLARQRETVAGAVGKVAEKIDGQTEDFLAIMGQFANDLGYAMARPSDYSPEVVALICARMAEGESLRSVCRSDEMPALDCLPLVG